MLFQSTKTEFMVLRMEGTFATLRTWLSGGGWYQLGDGVQGCVDWETLCSRIESYWEVGPDPGASGRVASLITSLGGKVISMGDRAIYADVEVLDLAVVERRALTSPI